MPVPRGSSKSIEISLPGAQISVRPFPPQLAWDTLGHPADEKRNNYANSSTKNKQLGGGRPWWKRGQPGLSSPFVLNMAAAMVTAK